MLKSNLVKDYKAEILSGLTVALALVPEAIAFAFVAGVDPLVGLYAAIIVGFVTSAFGGRPGMISGATGALAVVMAALFKSDPETKKYLFLMIIMMGVIQMIFGFLKLGKLIRLMPKPVMIGFVNGLAIVIFKSQFKSFINKDTGEIFAAPILIPMIIVIVSVMVIIKLFPKLTKAVPPILVAIGLSTFIIWILKIDIPTIKDVLEKGATLRGGFPKPSIPAVPTDMETFLKLFKTSFTLASIGIIYSLMSVTFIDDLTKTRGKGNREALAQGAANILTGIFGGMGGCSMIGQSIINIKSGGKGRVSGITASIGLLLIVLVGAPVIELIPTAALIGVMFIVVIGTFEWSTFKIIKKIPLSDVLVIIAVTIVTPLRDLSTAVFVGIIMSALVFAWESAKKVSIQTFIRKDGAREYNLQGAIFFASTTSFKRLFDFNCDESEVYIDFKNARVHDHSAIVAIDWLTEQFKEAGKKLHLLHLSEDCRKLLKNAGNMIEVNVVEDPDYNVSDNELA